MTVRINKQTGEVIIDGENPCQYCKNADQCNKSQLLPCFVPCG